MLPGNTPEEAAAKLQVTPNITAAQLAAVKAEHPWLQDVVLPTVD
jgi:hypothetical protein